MILQENNELSFEQMLASLERTEDKIKGNRSTGATSSSGSAFITSSSSNGKNHDVAMFVNGRITS